MNLLAEGVDIINVSMGISSDNKELQLLSKTLRANKYLLSVPLEITLGIYFTQHVMKKQLVV